MIRLKNIKQRPVAVRSVFLLLLFALSIGLTSCFKKPVFIKIDSVRIGAVKDSILEANISFKVYNPNGMGSTITTSKINTYYKNKLVGVSTLSKNISLPGKDTVDIPMVSKINLWTLAKVFPELLQNDTATFDITGDNKVKSMGITWSVPLKDKITINVKKVLTDQIDHTFKSDSNFKIKGLKFTKMPGLSTTRFQMTVELRNSFSFDYRLNHFNLDIYRKGQQAPIANWKLTDTVSLKAGAKSDIPIQVEIENFKLLSQARLSDIIHPNTVIVVKGSAEIYLQGHTYQIPIDETRQVSFNPLSGINF